MSLLNTADSSALVRITSASSCDGVASGVASRCVTAV
jgi:hypothetical protein